MIDRSVSNFKMRCGRRATNGDIENKAKVSRLTSFEGFISERVNIDSHISFEPVEIF